MFHGSEETSLSSVNVARKKLIKRNANPSTASVSSETKGQICQMLAIIFPDDFLGPDGHIEIWPCLPPGPRQFEDPRTASHRIPWARFSKIITLALSN